jgi:hypothetical protein
MRQICLAVLVLVFSVGVFAQRHGRASGSRGFGASSFRTFNNSSGYGNVVFPGTGGPPPMANPFNESFASRLGETVHGIPYFRGFGSRSGRGSGVVVWPYPVYVGGFENPYAYQQPPNVTIVMPPQQPAQPSAPVVINQNFVPESTKPVLQDFGPGSKPAPPAPEASSSNDQVLFLIALRDSSVYTAVAYWVDGDMLHYITPQGRHNQVSLALVDRDLSARLNQGRKVDFELPPAK